MRILILSAGTSIYRKHKFLKIRILIQKVFHTILIYVHRGWPFWNISQCPNRDFNLGYLKHFFSMTPKYWHLTNWAPKFHAGKKVCQSVYLKYFSVKQGHRNQGVGEDFGWSVDPISTWGQIMPTTLLIVLCLPHSNF